MQIQQIKSGQMPLAREWNALAETYNQGDIGFSGGGRSHYRDRGIVKAKNDSGTDRARFECMGLGDPLLSLTTDGRVDLAFELDTATSASTPAVLLEPIADQRIGYVVIDGMALAKVAAAAATTLDRAEPNTSSTLTATATGNITLLAAPSTTDATLIPVLLGQGAAATGVTMLFKTPMAGISAMTGSSSPWTPGSATCDVLEAYDASGTTKIQTGTGTATVYNSTDQTIAGSVVIQAKKIDGYWFVDTASCN